MVKMETASFLLIIAVGCFMVHTSNGLIHIVGGACGWEIPPNKTFYQEWAKPRVFGVGDELVFPYRPGGHTVHQVDKQDFDTCGHAHVIGQWASGPTRMKLNQTGDLYFYSGVGTHCEMGQKLHICVGNKPGSDGIDWVKVTKERSGVLPGRKMLMLSSEHDMLGHAL